jgi:hypothetical protein
MEAAMSVSVFVEQTNGQFSASLVGMPALRCVGPSRVEAIAALQGQIAQKFASGELLNIEIQPLGLSGSAGRFRDDPALPTIRDEIYRERDNQRPS